jgi:hypothetical protein
MTNLNELVENDRDLIEINSWNLSGGTEENQEKPVSRAGIPPEILTEHLPNTSRSVLAALTSEVLSAFLLLPGIGRTYIRVVLSTVRLFIGPE